MLAFFSWRVSVSLIIVRRPPGYDGSADAPIYRMYPFHYTAKVRFLFEKIEESVSF